MNPIADNQIADVEPLAFGWWIEVCLANPLRVNYFGQFESWAEAEYAKLGYIDDLTQEGAVVTRAVVRRCRPSQLTLDEQELRQKNFRLWAEQTYGPVKKMNR